MLENKTRYISVIYYVAHSCHSLTSCLFLACLLMTDYVKEFTCPIMQQIIIEKC